MKRRAKSSKHPQGRITVLVILFAAVVLLLGGLLCYRIGKDHPLSLAHKDTVVDKLAGIGIPDWIDQQLIHKHSTARTGKKLDGLKNIVIHYVANPGTSAQNNRDYFDKDSTTVSSHFLVGLEGEIIQCVPLYERAAANKPRNPDTISIEVCHPDESGKFADATYASLVRLTAWLAKETGLTADDVIRHYDVTGKLCPLYYVEHEDAWKTFIKDVKSRTYE